MQDDYEVKHYDFEDMNTEEDQYSFEINLNFIDVIALKICSEPKYKLVTYTDKIRTLEDLKDSFKLEDFQSRPENLTEKKFQDGI